MHKSVFGGLVGVCSFTIAALLTPCMAIFAETLVLKDGAVVHGEIKALQGDVYTVETELLGTLRVRKQDILRIDHSDGSTVASPGRSAHESAPAKTEIEAMQLRVMQSPELLSMIQALQDDPDVLAVLADPEIASAMASGDYATLMAHPKIIALTSNSKLRELIDAAH